MSEVLIFLLLLFELEVNYCSFAVGKLEDILPTVIFPTTLCFPVIGVVVVSLSAKLAEVIYNLLQNAIDYSPKKQK